MIKVDGIEVDHPFIDYVNEDKSRYVRAKDSTNLRTNKIWLDPDDDFMIGDSGGFLMDISWKFINTDLLRPAMLYFKKHKQYEGFSYTEGSVEYNKFWTEETRRRRVGITAPCKLMPDGSIEMLHISGDHYAYLNYGRINRSATPEETKIDIASGLDTAKDRVDFPNPWDGDYWYFKVDSFCRRNSINSVKCKARRKGYSYKKSNACANFLNLYPEQNIIFAAHEDKYLTDPNKLSDMCKKALDWYESSTYYKRFFISEGLKKVKLGIKESDKGHAESGWLSSFSSVSLSNSSSAAGAKAAEVVFEESGVNPVLQEALDIAMSTTESGAKKVGMIDVFGTAGTKDANWADFEEIYYNPAGNNMMTFENVWDPNSRDSTCGFFHPQIWCLEDEEGLLMDADGNSDLIASFVYDTKDKAYVKTVKELSTYLMYIGQRANSPSEAFSREGENIFSSVSLDEHIHNVKHNDDYKFGVDGQIIQTDKGLKFRTNEWIENNTQQKVHPFIDTLIRSKVKDPHGCIRMWFAPYRVNGKVPDNIYRVWYDPAGVNKDGEYITDKNSLSSIFVYRGHKQLLGAPRGDMIVAEYTGRTGQLKDMDTIAKLLAKFYNAEIQFENDRGETITNFRAWKELEMLAPEPNIAWDTKLAGGTGRNYGLSIGRGDRKMYGAVYLKDWIYTPVTKDEFGNQKLVLHYIYSLPFLLELQKWNMKGNFDRVSAAIVGMYDKKELLVNESEEDNDVINTISKSAICPFMTE